MKLLTKTLFVILSLLTFIYVLFFVPYPKSWEQASTFQILAFFVPILFFSTFLTNILLNNFTKSFAIGLGVMSLAAAQASKALNPFLATGIIVLFLFLAYKMPKAHFKRIPHFHRIKFSHPDKTSPPKLKKL